MLRIIEQLHDDGTTILWSPLLYAGICKAVPPFVVMLCDCCMSCCSNYGLRRNAKRFESGKAIRREIVYRRHGERREKTSSVCYYFFGFGVLLPVLLLLQSLFLLVDLRPITTTTTTTTTFVLS